MGVEGTMLGKSKGSHCLNKGAVAGFLQPQSRILSTALGVEICKLRIIARIWKPLPEKFSDLCSEMGICSDVL